MTACHCPVTAVAHSNIALAKYWGKADVTQNLPAVPSLSLTLDGLRTVTTVQYDATLDQDAAVLDGAPLAGRPLQRVVAMLDQIRARAGSTQCARVESRNDFPTAAGLASSASGFAALALAASRGAGLELSAAEVSALARQASASAARSVHGGFAELGAGAAAAVPVAPSTHWEVSMLVAVVASGPKHMGSTGGMQHTTATSPYYPAWLEHAPRLFDEVRQAVLDRDLTRLGPAMEQSAMMMHASMLAARPALTYFRPATWAVLQAVYSLRNAGVPAYFTIDAGPHVKVLTELKAQSQVAEALRAVPEVQQLIVCRPGPAACLVDDAAKDAQT